MKSINLGKLEKAALKDVTRVKTPAELENLQTKYLGRKSELSLFLRSLKDLPPEERAKSGQSANDLRKKLETEIGERTQQLKSEELVRKIEQEKIDVTAPGRRVEHGHLHPLTMVKREIEDIFRSMGFDVVEGPEVETEWYNFDVLNVPADHPAREMQDTFWIKQSPEAQKDPQKHLLPRTHTSAVQVRYMEKRQPPFRIIAPGKCFRNEATDATHEMQFHTFEGLMAGKDVSIANLKGVLQFFANKFFKDEVEIKFVASYFPYTEPSVEVWMKSRKGKLKDRWMEMAGAGMVHQKVFQNAGYVPREWQGFAFGMTVDKLAMIKYGIDDIRLLYGSDLRFLKQF
jgi:phenylalanyl-tRNA synthetase alpha chain